MFILYFLLWVIFNGRITWEICIFGILIAGAIFGFSCKFADYSVQKEIHIYKKIFQGVRYLVLLVLEILKANSNVLHLILSQEEEIEPVLVTFRSDRERPTGKAFLANAITLTPGTITVSLEGSEYVVHCLDESLAEGLENSEIEERLRKLEK